MRLSLTVGLGRGQERTERCKSSGLGQIFRERKRKSSAGSDRQTPAPKLTVNRVRASGKLKSAGVGDILVARARDRVAAPCDDVMLGATRRPGVARAASEPTGWAVR